MKPAPYKGKERRTSSLTKIRISPFMLVVRPKRNGGFICEFTGIGNDGKKIEIELEFPQWWAQELLDKVHIFISKGKR